MLLVHRALTLHRLDAEAEHKTGRFPSEADLEKLTV
jgi:hypothetical protein